MKKLIIFTFIFFLLSFIFCKATVRYVSHQGSNTPPYLTWETAADSIMFAINVSSFGDTIYVANGVYEEVIDMIEGLTLIGAGSDSCIVDTRNIQNFPGHSVVVADSCVLSGFNIFSDNINSGEGIYIVGGANSIVTNCKVQEAKDGILVWTAFQNKPLVYKNIVSNTEYGISNYFSQAIIKENIIYANGTATGGLGAGTNSRAKYLNNTVICNFCDVGYGGGNSILKNNLFYGNGDYGLACYGDSIVNNVIIGENGRWGDGIFGADLKIINNHIENATKAIRYDPGGGSTIVVKYNNLWNNQINYQNFNADSTNIYFNPMFVNEDSLDFHLQKYSPLIDAGDPNILDKDSTRSDIGLYGGPYGESYKYLDLPPRTPVNFSALLDTNYILLKWNRNREADFSHYNLYRDTTENFVIDSTTFVASLTDTFYLHIIPEGIDNLYFKLTAVDSQGNESEPSEELNVLLTGGINNEELTINNYRLFQNYPNPFNPSTRIGYRLKERGYVKLYVYDIKGELVETLVNGYQEAGYHEVVFEVKSKKPADGEVSFKNGEKGKSELASGIFLYQIMVKNDRNIPVFSDMGKMILLK